MAETRAAKCVSEGGTSQALAWFLSAHRRNARVFYWLGMNCGSDVCFCRRPSFHQLGARYPDREGFRFGRGGVGVADRPRFTPPSGLATRAVTGARSTHRAALHKFCGVLLASGDQEAVFDPPKRPRFRVVASPDFFISITPSRGHQLLNLRHSFVVVNRDCIP